MLQVSKPKACICILYCSDVTSSRYSKRRDYVLKILEDCKAIISHQLYHVSCACMTGNYAVDGDTVTRVCVCVCARVYRALSAGSQVKAQLIQWTASISE